MLNRRKHYTKCMTDADKVSFEFFKSDKDKYTVGDYAKLTGKLDKGGFFGHEVTITMTEPQRTHPLKLKVTKDGNFETPHKLQDAGTYTAQAKYLEKESDMISFTAN